MQDFNNRKKENPWNGLDSYKETQKLYGRDEEIESLYSRIIYNTQTVIYGRSGTGKSSILNAGIFPKARLDGILPVNIRLIHTSDHNNPSESYINQIHSAIENELNLHNGCLKEIIPQVSNHDESLWEYLHRYTFWIGEGDEYRRVKPLIVFDQFEEIFTLEKSHSRIIEFFAQLADLLNGIKPDYLIENSINEEYSADEESIKSSSGGNIFSGLKYRKRKSEPEYLQNDEFHIVLTLREDYLSYLERNSTNIPSLKLNRYCLQPINEEQAAIIIMEPFPGLVEKDVAKLIIEKVTGETNFELDGKPEIHVELAILSLYLSRLYDKKDDTLVKISADLVNKFGDNIIQDFYLESIAGVSESTVEYIEDNLLNNDGRRENVSEYNAIHIGGVSDEELIYLCEKKKLIRRFSYDGVIRIEYIHDILCPIIEERRDKRQILKQQVEEKQKLLHEEELKRKDLEDKARREKERMEWEARMVQRKNRQRLIIAIASVCLILLIWSGWYVLTVMSYSECYGSFTTKNGWPVGIGKELNLADEKDMVVYYKLTRKGWMPQFNLFRGKIIQGNPYERVDILNAENKPATNYFIESPLVSLDESESTDNNARQFAKMQRNTSYWIFTADNDGNLTRETAYSLDDKELYAIQFFRAESQDSDDALINKEKFLWANYIDKDGKSMKVRDNGVDRMRISIDDNGYYTGYAFFSESGTPQPNIDNVFGYSYLIGTNPENSGCIIKKISLDAFGDSIIDTNVKYTSFDDFGRWTESTFGKALYSKDLIIAANKMGNDTLRFDEKGCLTYKLYYSNKTWNIKEYYHDSLEQINRYQELKSGLKLIYLRKNIREKDSRPKKVIVFNADSTIPYMATIYEYAKDSSVISYFGGQNINDISQPITFPDKDGDYHKLITKILYKDSLRKEMKIYLNTSNTPCSNRTYFVDESYFKGNNRIKQIQFNNKNEIYKSYLYEYKDGLLISQSVMGIDGDRIRCPQWDEYRLCYYKMNFVRNFNGSFVAVRGVNEFGEKSLITLNEEEYNVEILPSVMMAKSDYDHDYSIYGIQVYKESFSKVNLNQSVQYIHILNRQGKFYSAGIRDGDILLKENKQVVIARVNISKKTFDILTFFVEDGDKGAEVYPVYYTNNEIYRLNKLINK